MLLSFFMIRLKRLNLTTFLNQNQHKRIINQAKAFILYLQVKKYSPSPVRYQKLLSDKVLVFPKDMTTQLFYFSIFPNSYDFSTIFLSIFLCMYLSFQTPFILFDFIVLVIMNNTLIVLHMPAKKGVNKFEMNRISAKRCIKSFAIKQNTFIFQISFRLNANLCFNFEDRVRFTNVYL